MIERGRPARGALLASLLLLAAVCVFCATTRWGRMFPKDLANTWSVWSHGHALNAAERRLLFYDETYPVLLYVRQNTPPGAVILLPPHAFVKSQVASRRPPGEDLVPFMGTSSSAYSVLYPRIPVLFDDDSPWKEKATHLLAWDWWGLDLVDPSIPHDEGNRVRLFSEPGGPDRAASATVPVPRIRRQLADDRTGPDRWITPSLLLGVLVLAAYGDALFRLLGRWRLRPATRGAMEGIAWRMLFAPAAVPWLVVCFDLAHVPITRRSLTAAGAALWLAGIAAARPGIPAVRNTVSPRGLLRSPAATVLALAAGLIVLASLIQVAILPERNYDAIVGFDLVGKIMAAEGRLHSSVFDRIAYNAQATYPPFTSTNNGFGYLFFDAVPRLWVPWMVAGFLIAFGSWVRRRTGSVTVAALAAFLVLLPQALLTQGTTEARPDLPSMVFIVMAALAGIDLFRGRGGWGSPALLLLVAATARTENALFGVALAAAALLVRTPPSPSARTSLPSRWKAAWFVLLPGAFFLFWNLLYVKGLIGYDPGAHFRRLDFAPGRMVEVVRRAVTIMAWPQVFGEFIVVVGAAPLAWVVWRWSRRHSARGGCGTPESSPVNGTGSADPRDPDPGARASVEDVTGMLLLVAGLMFVFYLPFFYAWDPVLNPLWSMKDTFKRGFFRFMPLLLTALLALPPVANLLRRCDGPAPPA